MIRRSIVCLLAVLAFLVACETSGYVGGLSGCRDFNRLLPHLRLGVLTEAEIREEFKDIRDRTSTAEPDIKAASTAMLVALTRRDADAVLTASQEMIDACLDAGHLEPA